MLLNAAADIVKDNAVAEAAMKTIKQSADNGVAVAERLEKLGDEENRTAVKGARRCANIMNKISALFAKSLAFRSEVAAECVKCASQRLAAGSKKA